MLGYIAFNIVSLKYFAGEKPLRMSQISRKVDPLQSNWQGSCVFTSTNLGFAILLLRIDQPSQSFAHICLMFAKHSSNTVGTVSHY